jgi:hypothetical protein
LRFIRCLRPTAWWCCLALATAHAGAAQAPARFGVEGFTASVGLAEAGRVDETASPLRYGGRGFDWTLAYERPLGAYWLQASLDGGTRSLLPLDITENSSEYLTEGALDLTVLRALRGTSALTQGLAAGVQFSANGALNEHTYATPAPLHSDFLLASGTLGPAVAWQRAMWGGRFSANVAIPLVALVDHPYEDLRVQRAPVDLRFVTIESYRAVNGGLSYSNPVSRTLGLVYAYHIGLLRFDDEQPVHAVTQTISVGLERLLGRDTK